MNSNTYHPKDRPRYRDEDRYSRRDLREESHNPAIGYILWIFGFTGAHRFYYGRPITGTIWFFTAGLLGIGWLIDLFLIPSMDRDANRRYIAGEKEYSLTWVLLTFGGLFGLHRFYMGKIFTGVIYLFTGGLFLVGYLYDYWTLNEQLDEINRDAGYAPGSGYR